jgi:hypothetical protein
MRGKTAKIFTKVAQLKTAHYFYCTKQHEAMTTEQIQNAIAKGKTVYFRNHNENARVTFFKVSHGIITIQAGNVRRFRETALQNFLGRAVIA